MKKLLLVAIVVLSTSAIVSAQTSQEPKVQNVRSEEARHPRIAKAIHQLEDAMDYLSKAPHDFGGYRVQAMADCKKAIESLKMAMHYRAVEDNKKQ